MRLLLVLFLSLIVFCTTAQQKNNFTIYFDFDSPKLSESAKQKLYQLVSEVKDQFPITITVNGYADKLGVTKYNEKLSLKRAEAVVSLLKNQFPPGINLSLNGLGSTHFISNEIDEQNLNRRVEIFFHYAARKDTLIEVEPFREDVPDQRFLVNLDDTVIVKASGGTVIKITPQSIQNRKGQLVNGNVEMLIKEYYDPSKIVLAGLHSYSDKGLLQSAGMINIIILQNGDTVNSKTLNPIQIRMPVIYPELNNMNVFSMPKKNDTVQWKNTGTAFNKSTNYWNFLENNAIEDVYLDEDIVLTNIPVGSSYSEEYSIFYSILPWSKSLRTYAKKVSLTISKIDSNTLAVKAKLKYRARGRRIIGKKKLDTTFMVNYMKAYYEGFTDNLNWINCDIFYDYKDKTDFYVNTPGIKGMNVMVYFKEIHAFMPAIYSGNRYLIPNVPANMKVIVTAIGKKGEDFYFGKNETTIGKDTFSLINIKITNKENLSKLMDNL